MDATGHVQISWDPSDDESVKGAEAEFVRLKEAGFSFFTSADPGAPRLVSGPLANPKLTHAEVYARLERVSEFKAVKQRTVAVRPMRGG
jgi:hypothetical protein